MFKQATTIYFSVATSWSLIHIFTFLMQRNPSVDIASLNYPRTSMFTNSMWIILFRSRIDYHPVFSRLCSSDDHGDVTCCYNMEIMFLELIVFVWR